MKKLLKFLFLVITGRLRPAFQILRDLKLATKLSFVAMGLISYVLHQYPRELYVLSERGYLAATLAAHGSGNGIRLSDASRQRLANLVESLHADHRLQPRDLSAEKEPNGWSTAQSLVAVSRQHRLDATSVRAFYERTVDDDCGCWREEKNRQPHTGATGWIVFAMSEHGIPAPARTVSYLLSAQSPDGWWALHPAAAMEARNASTYATAWATLGLCTQLPVRKGNSDPGGADKIKLSVAKALDWLSKHEIQQSARWYDYPANSPQIASLSVSGLVLHVMRMCGHEKELDRLHQQWLGGMPASVASGSTAEFSNVMLPLTNGVTEFDRTRHYVLQWTLIATVDAYARGNLLQRAAAQQWLERILTPGLASQDVRKQSWVSAELLYALRHLAEHLDRPLQMASK